MKRLSYVALMLLLVPVYAGAQFVLSGKITDKQSKEPIPGAKIYLKNSFKVTVTDEKGFYVFSKLKKGAYIVETSSLGFNNESKELIIEKNETLDFELTASVMLADEVIITATRANEKTPATYQDINKREISELNLGQDLPSILQHSISAVSTSDAGNGVGYTGLRIRGTDMTRINVTLNGVPYNEAESQEVYWVDIPDVASSTENIQIQRGVGTSNNGPAAFGASIN
ncbi:MAG: TonB-dependent receptor, partial [Bacteroidales bacterium]|nr:TonB-dependent receptor [Bacteroidales bacterium]